LGIQKNCFVFPFGLSTHRQFSLASSALSVNQRLKNKVVAFIGTWCPRKGSKDWCKIIQLIRQEIPEVQFLFLGTD
jgi:glycosyltransferase involved in cell wall biosynthesis